MKSTVNLYANVAWLLTAMRTNTAIEYPSKYEKVHFTCMQSVDTVRVNNSVHSAMVGLRLYTCNIELPATELQEKPERY